jgi:hypothetical protein
MPISSAAARGASESFELKQAVHYSSETKGDARFLALPSRDSLSAIGWDSPALGIEPSRFIARDQSLSDGLG